MRGEVPWASNRVSDPGKGWYVKGRRRAKCFGRNKVQAKVFADKLARLKWAEQSGEPVALTRPDGHIPTVADYLMEWLSSHADVQLELGNSAKVADLSAPRAVTSARHR